MKKLEERAAAIGRTAQERIMLRLEQQLREQGIAAEGEGDRLICSGKKLVKRWLSDSSLRFITGLMR